MVFFQNGLTCGLFGVLIFVPALKTQPELSDWWGASCARPRVIAGCLPVITIHHTHWAHSPCTQAHVGMDKPFYKPHLNSLINSWFLDGIISATLNLCTLYVFQIRMNNARISLQRCKCHLKRPQKHVRCYVTRGRCKIVLCFALRTIQPWYCCPFHGWRTIVAEQINKIWF